jgi:hypothetical protein
MLENKAFCPFKPNELCTENCPNYQMNKEWTANLASTQTPPTTTEEFLDTLKDPEGQEMRDGLKEAAKLALSAEARENCLII